MTLLLAKKVSLISQGCAANFGEGEKIARLIEQNNPACEITFDFPKNAPDFFVLNVCTVKGNSSALKLLRKAFEAFPSTPIYITGCTPKDFKEASLKDFPSVLFTSLHELESSLMQSIKKDSSVLRESPHIGIVNIEEGCLDACSFCSTHLVKGRLKSFSESFIIKQIQQFIDDGCSEIQLTGQDCACYGFDINTNLAELIQNILAHVSGNYKIRLGMGNPRHIMAYKEKLLECFYDDRVYKFLHVPVQSGSDNVLKNMNRKHSVSEYKNLALELQKMFPYFTLSTDLIVGHPGETPEDFNKTLNLLQETKPSICNITRFVARPGTVAAKMESNRELSIPDTIKHERSAILFDAFQKIALENNQKWIGKTCLAVTEKSGYREGTTIARNEAYRPIAIQGHFEAGKQIPVHITKAEPFALIGEGI